MRVRDAAAIIRESLTMEQIVGIYLPAERIKRGFISCPFHGETVGSLKLYDNTFYCFGCHAGGDAVDFVGRLFSISPAEAITRINDDFALDLPLGNSTMQQRINVRRRSAELIKARKSAQETSRAREHAYSDIVEQWTEESVQMRDNAPTDPDAPFPVAWVEAARKIDQTTWILNETELPGRR